MRNEVISRPNTLIPHINYDLSNTLSKFKNLGERQKRRMDLGSTSQKKE